MAGGVLSGELSTYTRRDFFADDERRRGRWARSVDHVDGARRLSPDEVVDEFARRIHGLSSHTGTA